MEPFWIIEGLILILGIAPLWIAYWASTEKHLHLKHLQILSGMHPFTYWLMNYLVDVVEILFGSLLCIAVLALMNIQLLSSTAYIHPILLIVIPFAFAVPPFTYVMCFLFNHLVFVQLIVLALNLVVSSLLAYISFIVLTLGQMMEDKGIESLGAFVRVVGRLLPAFNVYNYLLSLGFSASFGTTVVDPHYGSYITDIQWLVTMTAIYWILLGILESWNLYRERLLKEGHRILRNSRQHLSSFFSRCLSSSPSTDPLSRQSLLNLQGEGGNPAEASTTLSLTPQGESDGTMQMLQKKDFSGKMMEREDLEENNLHVWDLCKTYFPSLLSRIFCKGKKPLQAVQNVGFSTLHGTIVTLLGANGSGKSTLINLLTGILYKNSGGMAIGTVDMETSPRDYLSHVGICPQSDALWDDLTVLQHLVFFATLQGYKNDDIVLLMMQQLQTFNISEFAHYKVANLSGGTRRKLNILIALLGQRNVILLDEPSTGFDPLSRMRFVKFLSGWSCREAKIFPTIIISTHAFEEAEEIADKLMLLSDGKKCYFGSLGEAKECYNHLYEISIKLPEPSLKEIQQRLHSWILTEQTSIHFLKAQSLFAKSLLEESSLFFGREKNTTSLTSTSWDSLIFYNKSMSIFSMRWNSFSAFSNPSITPKSFARWYCLFEKSQRFLSLLRAEAFHVDIAEINNLNFKLSVILSENRTLAHLLSLFHEEKFISDLGFPMGEFSFSSASLNQLVTLLK
ncbi:hypothetical protein IE077_000304 [Cardiosporidium cionae]|uniref:ABC transporter domain-containing protein n=1 Tax=Cardiosporidium cionae TaxID=476202 RepID=A0ABQ7JBE1_9APIC|nr:hypothetical protein IE077_000304 [Cardiosporidium cionae]|eukprot:KAF8821322.1 hypothetical protein IE077_000304 [Cardiosporidium cionae]